MGVATVDAATVDAAGEVAAARDACPDAGDNEITENPSEVMTAVITNTRRILSPIVANAGPDVWSGRSLNARASSHICAERSGPVVARAFTASLCSVPLTAGHCSRL